MVMNSEDECHREARARELRYYEVVKVKVETTSVHRETRVYTME
jgi:hypothetical protein